MVISLDNIFFLVKFTVKKHFLAPPPPLPPLAAEWVAPQYHLFINGTFLELLFLQNN